MGGNTLGRGTSNSNSRGNTVDRINRKNWVLKTFAANVSLGEEAACRCYRCGILLTFDTLTIDRIIPGKDGGTYRRNNIRPACASCNIWRGNQRC